MPLCDFTRGVTVTPATHPEMSICCSTTSVYQALKHLLHSCTLGGLVFQKNFAVSGIKRHLFPGHVYSLVVLIFLVPNVLRWFTIFRDDESFGTDLFLKVCHCVWALEALGHYIVCVITCESYSRLPLFFHEWEKIRGNCPRNLNSMNHLAIVSTILLWLAIGANSAFATYLIFWTTTHDFLLSPWYNNFEYTVTIQVINAIQGVYLTFAWIGPSVLMFVICRVMACDFDDVTSEVKQLSRHEGADFVATFEELRRHHQKLCNLVSNADAIFSMQIAISFCGSLILACLVLYIMVYDEDPERSGTLVFFVECFWLCMSLAKVVLDCFSGAILNEKVRCDLRLKISIQFILYINM